MSLWADLIGAVIAFSKSPKGLITTGLPSGYTTMKNMPKLLTAILEAYENPAFKPVIENGKVVTTFCNQAVNAVALAMGCPDFDRLTADEICQFLEQGKGWTEVLLRDCQFMANEGSLIVAALSSQALGSSHGHVCVVRPGMQIWSEHWKSMVPAVMNVGGQNFILRFQAFGGGFIEAGVNGAFQIIPRFFAWEASL